MGSKYSFYILCTLQNNIDIAAVVMEEVEHYLNADFALLLASWNKVEEVLDFGWLLSCHQVVLNS